MAKFMSIAEAARVAGCSSSALGKLVTAGKIPAVRTGPAPHGRWRVTESRVRIREIVNRTIPRHGYKKNGAASAPVVATKPSSGLAELGRWILIPKETRAVLLKLAGKFSVADLRLLLEL